MADWASCFAHSKFASLSMQNVMKMINFTWNISNFSWAHDIADVPGCLSVKSQGNTHGVAKWTWPSERHIEWDLVGFMSWATKQRFPLFSQNEWQTDKQRKIIQTSKIPFAGRSGSKNHLDGSFHLTLVEVWSSDLLYFFIWLP